MSYSGSCMCGKVTFRLEGEPNVCVVCYCSDCRKGSGHLGQILAEYKSDKVHIEDKENKLTEYVVTKTASGQPKKKYFCGGCGSTIRTIPMLANGEISYVRHTLIDGDFSNLLPTSSIFNDEKERVTGGKKSEYY